MSNRLNRAVQPLESRLSADGITVTYKDAGHGTASGVDLDSEKFVGTIMYWPESLFEFQFNRCDNGEVEVLETQEFGSDERLTAYLEELLFKRLA